MLLGTVMPLGLLLSRNRFGRRFFRLFFNGRLFLLRCRLGRRFRRRGRLFHWRRDTAFDGLVDDVVDIDTAEDGGGHQIGFGRRQFGQRLVFDAQREFQRDGQGAGGVGDKLLACDNVTGDLHFRRRKHGVEFDDALPAEFRENPQRLDGFLQIGRAEQRRQRAVRQFLRSGADFDAGQAAAGGEIGDGRGGGAPAGLLQLVGARADAPKLWRAEISVDQRQRVADVVDVAVLERDGLARSQAGAHVVFKFFAFDDVFDMVEAVREILQRLKPVDGEGGVETFRVRVEHEHGGVEEMADLDRAVDFLDGEFADGGVFVREGAVGEAVVGGEIAGDGEDLHADGIQFRLHVRQVLPELGVRIFIEISGLRCPWQRHVIVVEGRGFGKILRNGPGDKFRVLEGIQLMATHPLDGAERKAATRDWTDAERSDF